MSAPTVTPDGDTGAAAALLALSDERDTWLARVLDAERRGYDVGYDAGRVDAAVAIAEIEDRWTQVEQWRRFTAWHKRVTASPDTRIRQALARIAADQKFIRDAQATAPIKRTPMQICMTTMRWVRLPDPEAGR